MLTDGWKTPVFNGENINKSEGKVILVNTEQYVLYRWRSDNWRHSKTAQRLKIFRSASYHTNRYSKCLCNKLLSYFNSNI